MSYNGITSAFQADDAGSIPATRSIFLRLELLLIYAHVAQSVEHFLGKEEVTGSIPVMSSNFELQFWSEVLKVKLFRLVASFSRIVIR